MLTLKMPVLYQLQYQKSFNLLEYKTLAYMQPCMDLCAKKLHIPDGELVNFTLSGYLLENTPHKKKPERGVWVFSLSV